VALLRSLFLPETFKEAERAAVLNAPAPVVQQEVSLVTVEPRSGEPDVRHFDTKAINDYIEKAMTVLPADKTLAAIVWGDVTKGKNPRANISVVGRKKSPVLGGKVEWTVYGHAEWHGDLGAGAAVKWMR